MVVGAKRKVVTRRFVANYLEIARGIVFFASTRISGTNAGTGVYPVVNMAAPGGSSMVRSPKNGGFTRR